MSAAGGAAPVADSVMPLAPATVEASGLSFDLLQQLALKALHFAGELTGVELGARLGLPWSVIEPVVEALKNQRQCEIAGGSYLGGASFTYRITDGGRSRAALFLEASRYVGIAPVPLPQYLAYLKAWSRASQPDVTPTVMEKGFQGLILPPKTLDQLGPAIRAGRSIFVYGAAGNGKTQVAKRVRDVMGGTIAIPHAIEVEGQIIRMFDTVVHEPVEMPASSGFDRATEPDGRWVLCRRPVVMVGGELTMDTLELGAATAGFYKAPIQLRANGGVLVIDDFGRQRCSPAELLNRWIVPLESRVDFLTLSTGQVFEVPFNVLVVFATNLRPQDLMDEAFMRRIHAKIQLPDPTPQQFAGIFEGYCRSVDVPYDASLVDHLVHGYFATHHQAIRGCHARDLVEHALLLAQYRGEPRQLTPALLDAACEVYFVRIEDGASSVVR